MNGKGKMKVLKNDNYTGEVYEGEFKDDDFHGYGELKISEN